MKIIKRIYSSIAYLDINRMFIPRCIDCVHNNKNNINKCRVYNCFTFIARFSSIKCGIQGKNFLPLC